MWVPSHIVISPCIAVLPAGPPGHHHCSIHILHLCPAVPLARAASSDLHPLHPLRPLPPHQHLFPLLHGGLYWPRKSSKGWLVWLLCPSSMCDFITWYYNHNLSNRNPLHKVSSPLPFKSKVIAKGVFSQQYIHLFALERQYGEASTKSAPVLPSKPLSTDEWFSLLQGILTSSKLLLTCIPMLKGRAEWQERCCCQIMLCKHNTTWCY